MSEKEDLIRKILEIEARALEPIVRELVESGRPVSLVRSPIPGGLAWALKER